MKDIFGKALKGYLNGDLTEHKIQVEKGCLDVLDTGIYFGNYPDWNYYEKS